MSQLRGFSLAVCFVLFGVISVVSCMGLQPKYSNTNQIYVATNGSDTTGTGTETNPFKSVGVGLAHSVTGGILNLYPGEYSGKLNTHIIIDRGIWIRSTTETYDDVVINCDYGNPIVYCWQLYSEYPISVSSVTFTGPNPMGTLDSPLGATNFIENVHFNDSAGVSSTSHMGSLSLKNCIFDVANTPITCNHGGYINVEGCEFRYATYQQRLVNSNNCAIDFVSTSFPYSSQYYAIEAQHSVITLTDIEFTQGAGRFLAANRSMIVANEFSVSNTKTDPASTTSRMVFCTVESTLTINNSNFGPLSSEKSRYTGLFEDVIINATSSFVEVKNSVFQNMNTATMILLYTGSSLQVIDSKFTNTTSPVAQHGNAGNMLFRNSELIDAPISKSSSTDFIFYNTTIQV